MRILDLALKDIQQVTRDKQAFLFLVLMPVLFTAFMGVMQSPPAAPADPRVPIGFINLDTTGALGAAFRSVLETSDAVRPVEVEQDDQALGRELVRDGKLAALVVAPDRFSASLLAGDPIALDVTLDGAQAAGRTADTALRVASTRLLGALETARLAAHSPADFDEVFQAALQAWQRPPIGMTLQAAHAPEAEVQRATGFKQSSPGMLVMFTVFGLTTTATVLVLERKTRTLQRMLTTSLRRAEIIAGHWLAMFTIVFMQEALLVIFAQVFLGVDYLREALATLLVMTAFAACIAAFGLFISTIAKSEEQAVMFALVAMFVLAALGGAWFPLDVTGQAFNTIGHLTPGAWAMDGFQNIVVRGLGLTSVLLPALVLAGYTVALLGLAVWKFKTE